MKNVSIYSTCYFNFYPNCILIITNHYVSLLKIGGKAFTSKEFLKTHFDGKHYDERIKTRDDGIFECNICNRELKSYGHAERHMKLLHPSEGSKYLNFEDSKVNMFNFFVIIKELFKHCLN